jgi:D-glucuronyl C5-epimerase C-terminus
VTSVRGLLTLLVGAAALLLAGAAPATSLIPLEKAALGSVNRAAKAHRIDAKTAAAARTEIGRAAHLIRTLPNGRAIHVRSALEEVAAFRAPLTLPRALELYGALKTNDDYFLKHWAPADKTDVVGSDGVVYRYFSGYCFRFHPLANFGVLNARVAAGDVDGTQALAEALIERGVYQRGGGIGWEYDFAFGGGRAPWLSGMAQAVAAQAFARAAALVTDRKVAYMREATAAYRLIPRALLTTVTAGPWIRLYAFDRTPVLNAQLQATLSLQTYAEAADNPDASALASRMEKAAAATLPRFDTGYWSYYSLDGVPSTVDYHKYVVSLLKKLAPEDSRFADAAARFAAYEKQPPAFRLDNAGVGQVRFWLSKPASVAVDTGAGPSKRLALDGGWHTLSWGEPRNPGLYPVHVSAVDWLGNKTSFDALPIVKVGTAKGKKTPARSTSDASSPGQPTFAVGTAVDDPRQAAIVQRLGLQVARVGVAWPDGSAAPDPGLVAAFGGLPDGIAAFVELIVGELPTDPTAQAALAQYAASLAQQVPAIHDLVLVPAPTTDTAPLYASLLESVRDAVHAVAPDVAVGPLVDGSASPKPTVAALGRAFTATGHGQPWADVLAFRPAPQSGNGAWLEPAAAPLTKAFGGTLPPLVIDGVATPTSITPAEKPNYGTVTPPDDRVTPAAQASLYSTAISSAACSPSIAGVIFDRLVDNPEAGAPPTGLIWASGSDKPSAAAVTNAAALAQRGASVCPGLEIPAAASTITYPDSVRSSVPVSLQLACVRDCLYVATLVGGDGRPIVATRGALQGGAAATTVALPTTTLAQSSYTLDVRLVSQVNPGTLTKLVSPPLPLTSG